MSVASKIIAIGLDGFEPSIVEELLAAGALPHLARLRAAGGYCRLATTYPAQTPVAWSTFATGTNPGGHGIFDFVRRDPQTYLPDFSLNRYERPASYLPPKAVNLRRGVPFWELLSKAGVASSIVRCPCTFPPDNIRGRMLAGMGVPDLRGGQGSSTLYTSAAEARAQEGERVVTVQRGADGTITTHLIGPRDPKTRADFRLPIRIEARPQAQQAVVHSNGQPETMLLRQGEWSDWLKVRFKTGLLQGVRAMVRFYLVRAEPVFELYASPLNFDPAAPLFPISTPAEYAAELAATVGTFYTTGMVEDHSGFENGRLSRDGYLQQCTAVLAERERMLRYELERCDRGFLFCLFDTPDRVQHMFWRDRAAGGAAARVIDDHYHACDALIGRVLDTADAHTTVIVLSDHGMRSFERGVHLNTWLHDQGLLALRDGVRPGAAAGDFFHAVDWDRTRAYALGLSGIYFNLRGREGRGTVAPNEAAALGAAIVKELAALGDTARGAPAVRSVLSRAQVYSGPYAAESPDLIVNFAAGYRVSWATALGGVPAGHFEDNTRKWAADHIMDPTLVPGVLFANRPIHQQTPDLRDLAPTILAALGVAPGEAMGGTPLLG